MRKSIWIFLLAVLLPSVVLGWLALRSAKEQMIILERQSAELYQKETESVAAVARTVIDDQRKMFAEAVHQLLMDEVPEKVAEDFAPRLTRMWPRKAIGFTLGKDGHLLCPTNRWARDNPEVQKFLLDNSAFLGGSLAATVYPVAVDELNRPDLIRRKGQNDQQSQEYNSKLAFASRSIRKRASAIPLPSDNSADPKSAPATEKPQTPSPNAPPISVEDRLAAEQLAEFEAQRRIEASERKVSPQQEGVAVTNLWSATTPFRTLAAESTEGMITRFVQDHLDMIFWVRPEEAPDLVFGCLIEADSLRDLWDDALPKTVAKSGSNRTSSEAKPDFVLALLDDKARPVVTLPRGDTQREWKRPFVASEIGEALPHWEAALYLVRPEQLQQSATGLRRTVIFLTVTMLGAIACGGWLVVQDARRQMALAQQKTDFVSNVSHELKTPLTSIRMFAELMQNGRAETSAKFPQYLRIIMVEAERLTRLINNVLDFAKLERKQKRFEKRPLDLYSVIDRVWEGQELHLRESGFVTHWESADPPYPVIGDEDALAQILVNLISNAEKYAGSQKEVSIHSYLDEAFVCVSVLDRGAGVPQGEERKIFEPFYRAHDSLSSGIQGSGLGLTLARRLAHEHDGGILYSRRPDGGSNFTLRIPVAQSSDVQS